MIYLKTDEEVELIRESNLLVAKTLAEVGKNVKPGITTLQLDRIAEEFIRSNGGVPSFLGYAGFPNSICTSVNEQVVHGIPSNKPLKEGDIVSVDCGALKNGFHGDSCYTFCVGNVSLEVMKLLKATKNALSKGIEAAVAGARLGNIGEAIQTYCEGNGFSVVREFVGHGIGHDMHEEPVVPNYGRKGSGMKLRDGMVIAIEPMICSGKRNVYMMEDGWTVVTSDGKYAAHYEHTLVIRRGKSEVLSSFEYVEQVLGKKAI